MLAAAGRWYEAGLAALLMVTLPAFIVLARSPMSEISSGFLIVLGHYCLFLFLIGRPIWWGFMGASLLGVALWFRLANLMFLSGLILAGAASSGAWKQRLLRGALFVATAGLFSLPLILYQYTAFGSPVQTGYEFWFSSFRSLSATFHPKYIVAHAAYLFDELSPPQTQWSTARLYGEGNYFGPALAALVVLTFWRQRRCRLFWVLTLPGLVFFAVICTYRFQSARLLFPLLLLAIPWIAVSFSETLKRASWVSRLLFWTPLLLAQLSIFPGRKFDPDFHRYVTPHRLIGPAPHYQAVRRFQKIDGTQRALILTDINPAYVHSLLNGDPTVAFLLDDHFYRYSPAVFRYGERERQAQVQKAISKGRRVFAVVSKNSTES